MFMKHSIQIDEKIYNSLKSYCDLNGLKISDFACKLIKNGLSIEKYGNIPFGNVLGSEITEYSSVTESTNCEVITDKISEIECNNIVNTDNTIKEIYNIEDNSNKIKKRRL